MTHSMTRLFALCLPVRVRTRTGGLAWDKAASGRVRVGRVRSLAFLSILRGCSLLAIDMQSLEVLLCEMVFRSLLAGGFLSPKEHGMGSQDTEFHRSACLIDARGTLTAMDDLTGGEADRVQILRATELAREDA